MAILLIDSYDSFTYNLHKLVEQVTQAPVVTVHNDKVTGADLEKYHHLFDAVVLGPGPGSPTNPSDIGVLDDVWSLSIPVFGVCLGFQCLVLHCGGQIDRLARPHHGQPSQIEHTGESIFAGIPQKFEAIRYHSLYAANSLGSVVPLAWSADDSVLMAGKHATKPFYGVQYHPESICSTQGHEVFSNFWNLAKEYNHDCRTNRPLDKAALQEFIDKFSAKPYPLEVAIDNLPTCPDAHLALRTLSGKVSASVAIRLCDAIRSSLNCDFALLNSARDPGRWSIIGLLQHDTVIFRTRNNTLYKEPYNKSGTSEQTDLTDSSVWEHITKFMEPKIAQYRNNVQVQEHDLPFVGGLIGHFTYEQEAALAYVENCVLLDNQSNTIWLASIRPGFDMQSLEDCIKNALNDSSPVSESSGPSSIGPASVQIIDRNRYEQKFNQCQEYLHSGDSYELCLTAQTVITLPNPVDPWKIYKHLVNRNPAPYSCFLQFDRPLIGSSPERFMSWSRQGICEFRPIKGTVKKGPQMTRQKAEDILNSNKERGENLMIVDLIRHDLNQLLDNVRVDKLMTVEEYHTVYQLVSVIKGDLPTHGYKGIDVLATSLPPGSMTGAPKKRSVEILKSLEDTPRGSYSGVSGYWSVTDEGDWSVIIRSLFQHPDDEANVWRAGAGGAITVLSNATDEWNEMLTKLESVLIFD
uniref:aminodeoxychorismate synthase n=1 Tax=Blastobotrys adeninivorans TaxID=409370 RepID=A0A060T378_BLAAD